ncbi:hypothetical protein GKC30_14400 [Pseudodesulfovibrio sp. F-1]|uniref:Energy-coupling factor transport system substrate-specific component n=1 Tax=Pseudodesulfovibrio alkaliphilus TaxID=2661613 RepID=A0A7K1KRX3_9BACT|nr:MptD family putative ECF transporter S component [Pseudodesulfovibrio alkaliphilus]MUM78824.1 hypothetical protein [Pseudodesulfovibrio alkaliphilus]
MSSRIERFTTYDLVMLGIFNAALIIFFFATTMALHFFPILWGAMDPIINFVLAPIFLLMLVRVPKTGAITVHGLIIGLVHAAIGWWPGLVAGLTAGLFADGISYILGGYKQRSAVIGCILIFVTVKALVFYAPFYLFKFLPWFDEALQMWPQETIEKYTLYYAVGFLLFNLAACSVGLLLGHRLINKHFKNTRLCPAEK